MKHEITPSNIHLLTSIRCYLLLLEVISIIDHFKLGLPFYGSDEGQLALEKAPLFKVGNDRKSLRTTAELKMERAEGLLGGKSLIKSQNDGTIEKTTVVCTICQAEFSYHRSSSSLSYHLNAKDPTESSPRLDGRQPTIHDFSRKITRPVREKVTNAVAVWVAGDCRTINIVEDGGLTEVFRIASGDNSYDLPSRGTIVSRIHALADGERSRKKYN